MTDYALIAMMILPILACMVLKILFTPESEGISIAGAMIFLEIPAPVMPLIITESQINSWAVMISILGLCLYLTHGLTAKAVPTVDHEHRVGGGIMSLMWRWINRKAKPVHDYDKVAEDLFTLLV